MLYVKIYYLLINTFIYIKLKIYNLIIKNYIKIISKHVYQLFKKDSNKQIKLEA